jgi:Glycosyltransferase family 92
MAMNREAGKPYLAVCAIYRWEGAYLREWVAFHRLVGVERFFLYDNGSQDDHLEALRPFIEDSSVVLHPWDVHPGQGPAYDHCLENHGAEARWLAFIDCDEFLFSPTGRPLPEVLRDYEQFPGLGVNRAWMGTSFHRNRQPGLVIENYSHRLHLPEPNRAVKSIIDPARTERRYNAHSFLYRDGALAVDENKKEFEGWIAPSNTFERLRVNHYFTKSEEEALEKFTRPQAGTGELRPELSLESLRKRNERFARPDNAIQRWLPELKEEMARLAAR